MVRWSDLTGKSRTRAIVIAMSLVMIVGVWYNYGSSFTAWWVGIPQAQKANTEAIRQLENASGAAETVRRENLETQADYARTQEVVRSLASRVGELSRAADAALAASRSKDVTILRLQEQLSSAKSKRLAQARTTTIQEAHDALAAINPVYR